MMSLLFHVYLNINIYGFTNYEGVLGAVCSMELQNIKTFTSLLTSPMSFLFLVPDDLHFSPESFSTYF